MKTKIILWGYMGAGKSTIGKELALKMQLEFVDLDTFIEKKEQKNITEIFQNYGNIYFRKKERQYLEELLLQKEALVIATGGGTPCFGDNISLMKAYSKHIFYIHLTAQTLIERLKNETQRRPLIAHLPESYQWEEFINKHLFERNPFYTQADTILKTDGLSVSEIVEKIYSKVRE